MEEKTELFCSIVIFPSGKAGSFDKITAFGRTTEEAETLVKEALGPEHRWPSKCVFSHYNQTGRTIT